METWVWGRKKQSGLHWSVVGFTRMEAACCEQGQSPQTQGCTASFSFALHLPCQPRGSGGCCQAPTLNEYRIPLKFKELVCKWLVNIFYRRERYVNNYILDPSCPPKFFITTLFYWLFTTVVLCIACCSTSMSDAHLFFSDCCSVPSLPSRWQEVLHGLQDINARRHSVWPPGSGYVDSTWDETRATHQRSVDSSYWRLFSASQKLFWFRHWLAGSSIQPLDGSDDAAVKCFHRSSSSHFKQSKCGDWWRVQLRLTFSTLWNATCPPTGTYRCSALVA